MKSKFLKRFWLQTSISIDLINSWNDTHHHENDDHDCFIWFNSNLIRIVYDHDFCCLKTNLYASASAIIKTISWHFLLKTATIKKINVFVLSAALSAKSHLTSRHACVISSVNSSPALQLNSENISQTARPFYSLIASTSINNLSVFQTDSKQKIKQPPMHLIVRDRMQHLRHQKIASASDDISIKCSFDYFIKSIISISIKHVFYVSANDHFNVSKMIILNDHFMHVKQIKLTVIFFYDQFFNSSIFFSISLDQITQIGQQMKKTTKKIKNIKKKNYKQWKKLKIKMKISC